MLILPSSRQSETYVKPNNLRNEKKKFQLKFTRVSLRGVSQLEGKDAVIRDALEDSWFNYKYPFIKKTRDQRSDQGKEKIK